MLWTISRFEGVRVAVIEKNILTKKIKLALLLCELQLICSQFSGKIEIHVVQGGIRNVVKIESIDITD
jgi:hypothetical protein